MTPSPDILITGATGTLGSALVDQLLLRKDARRVIVFSRDEHKQWQMRNRVKDDRLRYFLGDVRDRDRLKVAMKGVGTVIHAAAMKQIDAVEFNPIEAKKTNVDGTENVLFAALENEVEAVQYISSDKAHDPSCLYGASKAMAEKLTLAFKAYAPDIRFSAVRLANIAGSRGSIVEYLRSLPPDVPVNVTDPHMTRYWMTAAQAARFCLTCLDEKRTGLQEPTADVVRLGDVLTALAQGRQQRIVGLRPGEKMHEVLGGVSSENVPERLSVAEIRRSVA